MREARQRTAYRPQRAPFAIGIATFLLGGVVLLGWRAQIPALVQILPGFGRMPPAVALGHMVCGIGLVVHAWGWRAFTRTCGGLVGLLGLLNIVEYASGVRFGIDAVLFQVLGLGDVSPVVRMAPITAVTYLFTGSAFVASSSTFPIHWKPLGGGILCTAVIGSSLLGVLAYVTGLIAAQQSAYLQGMAIHTAVGFCFVAVALLLSQPRAANQADAGTGALTAANRGRSRNMLVLLVLGIGVFLTSIGTLLLGLHQSEQADGRVRHSLEVLLALQQMDKALVDKETGLRGFIIRAEPRFLEPLLTGSQTYTESFRRAKDLTRDNPTAQLRLAHIDAAVREWDGFAEPWIKPTAARAHLPFPAELAVADRGKALMDSLRRLVGQAIDTEVALLHEREASESASRIWLALTVVVCLAAGIAICAALFVLARRIEAQREALVVEAQRREVINHELESFAYSVSHDLRQPLRGMAGFSELLLQDYSDKLDAQGKDYLQRIVAASVRMAGLIDDLLVLSRVTRGQLKHQNLNLSAMAQAIVDDLRVGEPGRTVEVRIAPDLQTDGDARLMHALLSNLIANAWKFTSKTANARIEVGIEPQGTNTAYFVRDNGAGFDMAYRDKLFGAFQRLHGVEEFPGNGIGLATVQRIVQRHGGHVWAEGAKNQGATFYFTLS